MNIFKKLSNLLTAKGQAEHGGLEHTGTERAGNEHAGNEHAGNERAEQVSLAKENDRSENPSRIYRREFYPLRKIFLWGWDKGNNPAFLVLYGLHQFQNAGANSSILAENVTYTDYAVFSGKGGHFPSFESVRILDTRDGRRMHYKKDAGRWWAFDADTAYKGFKTLKQGSEISLPYFRQMSYEEYVSYLDKQKIKFDNFQLARTPDEVLRMDQKLIEYADTVYTLLSNPNIYLRKKALHELLQSQPPQELFQFLMRVGSCELISGLFLELSLLKNDVLVDEAKHIMQADIQWVSGSYLNGLRRCAALYRDVFDKEASAKRIAYIRTNLPAMDLHPLSINGKEIPKDKILEGADFARFARKDFFKEFDYSYSSEQRRMIKQRRSGLFAKGPYTDGVVLNITDFKAAIQEAEIYGLADVLGKIAYYLDAPRLTYYFKGSGKTKALMYFRRYIRRVLDSYAVHDEDKFMEAMGALLTSYTDNDYTCRFKGNFQFNYFIKHYLYFDFNEKAPDDWVLGYEWRKNDQLMKLEGSYAFKPEVWRRHVLGLIDILAESKIPVILKALYFLLKDCADTEYLTEELSYERLLQLIFSSYQPAAAMFMEILAQKLERENQFKTAIMIRLMKCPHPHVREMAMSYFDRTGGRFSAEGLAALLFIPGFAAWKEVLGQSLEAFDDNEYALFLHAFIGCLDTAAAVGPAGSPAGSLQDRADMTEDLLETLQQSLNRLATLPREKMIDLLSAVTAVFSLAKPLPENIARFVEAVVLAGPLPRLKEILESIDVKDEKSVASPRGRIMLALLQAIKTDSLPADAVLTDMLEMGSAPMINVLVRIMGSHKERLTARFSTVLIMLESNVAALNGIAHGVFDGMSGEEQKRLHSLIINSPDKKVYEYGLQKLYEIYEQPGSVIPEDLILQMFEHESYEVKSYISGKLTDIIKTMGHGNKELFMYYAKTLLLLPNRVSKVKDDIYEILPVFVKTYKDKLSQVEGLLLDIGGSNIIVDSERALTALVKIRREVA